MLGKLYGLPKHFPILGVSGEMILIKQLTISHSISISSNIINYKMDMDDVLVSTPLDSLNTPSNSALNSALQNLPGSLASSVTRPRGRPPSRPSAETSHIAERPNVDAAGVANNGLQVTSSTSKQKKGTAGDPESHVQTRAR